MSPTRRQRPAAVLAALLLVGLAPAAARAADASVDPGASLAAPVPKSQRFT